MSQTPQRPAHASQPTLASTSPSPDIKRRRFLLAFGAGTAGAAVAVTQPLTAGLAEPVAAVDATTGYRDTEHIRDYYATTRI